MYKYLNSVIGVASGAGGSIKSVAGFTVLLANLFVIIAAGVSVISMAFSFIQIITSAGDPKAAQKAQTGVLWGGIGLIVSILAFVIKDVIVSVAGVKGIK